MSDETLFLAWLLVAVLCYGIGFWFGRYTKPNYETKMDITPNDNGTYTIQTYAVRVTRAATGRVDNG